MFHISWNILCAQPVYRDSLTDNHFFLQKLLSYATIHSPEIIDVNHEVFYAVVKNKSQIFLLGPDDFLISILSDEEYHRNIQKNFGTIILVIMPDRSPAFLLDFLWYALRHKR